MVVTSGTADLTVDENTKYQRWEGFGGTFNEMGWDALSVVGAAETTKALKLLFDARDGANFVYGRLPVGASDYAMSWYTLAETANDYAMANFSIARDREKLIPYIKAALQVRPDIHLWASPWIPPPWMKDSGGNMKSDAQTQGAYALYLAKFVEEYGKEGLKIEAITPRTSPATRRSNGRRRSSSTSSRPTSGPRLPSETSPRRSGAEPCRTRQTEPGRPRSRTMRRP